MAMVLHPRVGEMRIFAHQRGVNSSGGGAKRPSIILRVGVLAGVLGMAFLTGNFLGHLRLGARSPVDSTLASLAAAPDSGRTAKAGAAGYRDGSTEANLRRQTDAILAQGENAVASNRRLSVPSAANLTLRLRSVARLSSGEVQAGERITFVTEETFADASGREVPAGSRVEGVIAHSTAASVASGRLVLEIHSLHVGNRSLTLRALPLAALGAPRAAQSAPSFKADSPKFARRIPSGGLNPLEQIPEWEMRKRDPQATGISVGDLPRAHSTAAPPSGAGIQTREAVVPQETILEFELLQLPMFPQESEPREAPALVEPQGVKPHAPSEWHPRTRPRTARG